MPPVRPCGLLLCGGGGRRTCPRCGRVAFVVRALRLFNTPHAFEAPPFEGHGTPTSRGPPAPMPQGRGPPVTEHQQRWPRPLGPLQTQKGGGPVPHGAPPRRPRRWGSVMGGVTSYAQPPPPPKRDTHFKTVRRVTCHTPRVVRIGCAEACVGCRDPPPRNALEGKGPQRRPQRRLGRRLEEVAKAVGGGYCRLQTPLRPALGVRGTVAGRRLGALEGGRGVTPLPPPPLHASPQPPPPLQGWGWAMSREPLLRGPETCTRIPPAKELHPPLPPPPPLHSPSLNAPPPLPSTGLVPSD